MKKKRSITIRFKHFLNIIRVPLVVKKDSLNTIKMPSLKFSLNTTKSCRKFWKIQRGRCKTAGQIKCVTGKRWLPDKLIMESAKGTYWDDYSDIGLSSC